MAYTTANLLSSIERKSFSPANQATFNTADILAMADEILEGRIVPKLIKTREELFVTYKDYTITADQAAYDLPARALGIREVHIIDSNNSVVRNLDRINPEIVDSYDTGTPDYFYLRNNQLILYKSPANTQHTLRVFYFIACGALVETTATAVISAIDTGTNVVTVSTIPSTWATGDIFDFSRKAGNHEYVGNDFTSSNITSTAITFSSLPSNLAVGDYVSLTGESSLVQLPPMFRPALATLVAAEILLNTSQPGGEERKKEGMELLTDALEAFSPRVEGAIEIILPSWD